MICTLAPVNFSKSGARRWSGSAICGPVKVTTRMVVPLYGWFDPVFDPPLQAAIRPAPTIRTRALARCRLIASSPLNVDRTRWIRPGGQSAEYGMFSGSKPVCQAPKRLFDTKSSDVSPVLKVDLEALEKPVERGHKQAKRGQRNHESGRCRRPVKFALEREKV